MNVKAADRLDKATVSGLAISALYALPETEYALQRADGFSTIHADLLELLADDEDDEEQIKPTEYAFSRSLRLLLDTQALRLQSFPRASVTADFNGGIRLQWKANDRQLRVVIPSHVDGHHYLYHESGDLFEAMDDPSPVTLAEWLRWLTDERA